MGRSHAHAHAQAQAQALRHTQGLSASPLLTHLARVRAGLELGLEPRPGLGLGVDWARVGG